jgi:hypothetical protein
VLHIDDLDESDDILDCDERDERDEWLDELEIRDTAHEICVDERDENDEIDIFDEDDETVREFLDTRRRELDEDEYTVDEIDETHTVERTRAEVVQCVPVLDEMRSRTYIDLL